MTISAESIRGKHIKHLTVAEKEWIAANLMRMIVESLTRFAVAREVAAKLGA